MKVQKRMVEKVNNWENILSKVLIWTPSFVLTLFYIPNGLDKLVDPGQTGKIVESSVVMIIAGAFILIGTALFLLKKTMLIGTSMLVLYMLAITIIHIYKGKPAEILILILIATILATHIRKMNAFSLSSNKG